MTGHGRIQLDSATPPRVGARRSVLRRSLPGEYLALAMMFHAGFGGVVWALGSWQQPAGLAVVAASVWITGRSVGAFSEKVFAPFVSGGLLLGVCVLWQRGVSLPLATLDLFSLPVFAAMLGVVLVVDVIEIRLSPVPTAVLRRLRRWNWHRIAVGAFVSAFVVYMILIPAAGWIVERMQPPKAMRVLEGMSLAEQVRLRSVEALTALWFFLLGATIGSFLNVVAYRLPRRESVVFRRSHCPRCGTPIKARDNAPVFGWLLLRGRCRACQQAISVRYPIVEAIAGTIFLLLYFVELISGGANIPLREPNAYCGVVWIVLYTKWDLVRLYLFHCFSLSALLAWALIDLDRQRVPWRMPWLLGLVACALPALWPDLLPVPWIPREVFGSPPPTWLAAVTTSVTGGLTGAAVGWFVARATAFQPRPKRPVDTEGPARKVVPSSGHLVSAGIIAGMSVGWQATVGVWLLVLAMRPVAFTVARRLNSREPPIAAMLLVAYLIHLIAWRWLSMGFVRCWWPSLATSAFGWTFVAVAFASLWLVNCLLSKHREIAQQPSDFTEIAAAIANQPAADSAVSLRLTPSNHQGVRQ